MATKTIYVSKEPNSNKIKLRDSDGNDPGNDDLTTLVDPNDTVEWRLDTNSGLEGIIGVKKKNDTNDLLTGEPQESNGVWSATVVPVSPGKGKNEKYKIGYKIPNDDKKHWDDPKLQMNI